jgi:signal transduction histidine kinase/tetratricopeptide (TPR) repeat protein/ActR/RegA family two-component response regulator
LWWTAGAQATPAASSAEWEREVATIDALVENDAPAAQLRIAELQGAYPADGDARTKFRLLTVASKVFTLNGRGEEAVAAGQQACSIAAQLDEGARGEAYLRLAGGLDLLGRSDEALAAVERSVTSLASSGSPVLLAEALSRQNLIFIRRGETDKAAACATRLLQIADTAHDPMTSARAHGAMGHAVYQSGLFADARRHYEEMLSFARSGPSKRMLADALGRVALTAGAQGNPTEEESLQREALALWRQTRHQPNLPLSLANFAEGLHRHGRDAEALPLLDEAIKIYDSHPYQTGLLYALDNRSECRLASGDAAGALADAEAAHAIALKVKVSPMDIESARHAAEAAAALGDFPRAYRWSKTVDTLSVAASRNSIDRQVAELEERYATERKQREIAELAQRNARQASELEHRRLRQQLLISLLGGSLLTVAVAAGLLFRLRRSHRSLRFAHTELTGTHAELRAKTAFQEAQLQSTIDGILVVDSAGKKLFQNQRLNALFDIPPEIVESKHERAQLEYVMTRVKEPANFRASIDAIYAHPDKTSHDEIELDNGKVLDRYSAPVVARDGSHYGRIWVFRDVTDEKRAERDRLVFGKLESTGVLAGGIAHDYNNLLTVILLNLEMAASAQTSEADGDDYLRAAREATESARGLTHQLITFAQGGAPVRRLTDLAPLIRETVALSLSGSNVRSDFVLATDLRPVEVDPDQIAQVLRNMILNAREAQPDGGTVTVAALNVSLAAGEERSLPAGDYVRISLIDHGAGIPADILPRIFDPYFSTKERGTQKGMGLGLTVCHSIIQKHQGAITVHSSEGHGTTFQIYLPASSPAPTSPAMRRENPVSDVSRRGHILVMDDEVSMRATMAVALAKSGHTAQLVEEGNAAIEAYRAAGRSAQPFDAVLLDLTVRGGPGGAETLQRLLALDPNVRAIVMSGYADEEVMRNPTQFGFKDSLPKPFTLQMLLEVLSRVL